MEVRVETKSTPPGDTVGDVARRFGIATNVLRHWENLGLLRPHRTTGNQRRYTDEDLFRVAFIMQGKELGFDLDTIRDLMQAGAQVRWQRLRERIAELDAQLDRLNQARHVLASGLECEHDDFIDCPIFRNHLAGRIPTPPHQQPAR